MVPEPSPPQRPRRWKRRALTVLAIWAALLVLLVGNMLFDDALLPAEDLLLPRRDVRDEDNIAIGLAELPQELIQHPTFSEDDFWWCLTGQPDIADKVASLDDTRVFLELNAELLADQSRAMARPYYQCSRGTFAEMGTVMTALRPTAYLRTYRCYYHARTGDYPAILADAIEILDLFPKVCRGGAGWIDFLIVQSMSTDALSWVEMLAGARGVSPALLETAQAEISSRRPDRALLPMVLRHEFEQIRGADFEIAVPWGNPPLEWLPLRLRFKPNRTLNRYAQQLREILTWEPETFADLPEPWTERRLTGGALILSVLGGNSTGEIILSDLIGATPTFMGRWFRLETAWSGTLLLLALRLHEIERGELPRTLADLVPGYIAEVPVDPYDGQPFRYSRKHRYVYSVGPDLIDEGGDPEAGSYYSRYQEWEEPTFHLLLQ